jgi:hypothetical protein
MAYTIVKSDGTVLTTIADGTINTTSTSLGLPGRNFAGYGQYIDTNMVWLTENFADTTPPLNPLRGQLWFNTNDSAMYICPADGQTNTDEWITIALSRSNANTTFGTVTVTGNLTANNITSIHAIHVDSTVIENNNITTNNISAAGNIVGGVLSAAGTITGGNLYTSGTLTAVGNANVGNLRTSGAVSAAGNIAGGNLSITGNAALGGVLTDHYYNADGTPYIPPGTYTNSNVSLFLATSFGSNTITTTGNIQSGNLNTTGVYATTLSATGNITSANLYTGGFSASGNITGGNLSITGTANIGNVGATNIVTTSISTGANTTAGTITGNWTLSAGSKMQATYADLAERFAADAEYSPGTVVELGGEKEITLAKEDLSDNIFGVISDTAGYVMNSEAGPDETHPPVAMIGRVAVNVIGRISKGDRLVSAGNGNARSAKPGEATIYNTIGRALEDKTTDAVARVLSFVSAKL